MIWKRFTIFLLLVLVAVASCDGQPSTASDLAALQQVARTCPTGHDLAGLVGVDVSGSGRDDGILGSRKMVIEYEARRVAACSGHLRVVAFSSSAATTVTVLDGDLHPAGATEIARLRKVPELVRATMATIDAGLDPAAEQLPADGSDITAQFGLANEYAGQLNAGRSPEDTYKLDVQLLTDGIQTVGVLLNTPDLTASTASDLAGRLPVPAFPPGTAVKVSGLGKAVGPPPPTTYVDALKAFYLAYCQRTGATSCAAVTDYVAGR
jgi:hypothetical protein